MQSHENIGCRDETTLDELVVIALAYLHITQIKNEESKRSSLFTSNNCSSELYKSKTEKAQERDGNYLAGG